MQATLQEGIVNIRDLPIERQLEINGSMTVNRAREMQISSQADYEAAAGLLQDIKAQAKRIKDYWSEPKAKAAAAHKDIVAREKAMLNPLNEAESVIKGNMSKYMAAVEKARREAAEAAMARQKEEAERLLNQAINAEEGGDDQAAAINLAMAEMVTDMQTPSPIEAPRAEGVSTRKTWKARVTDPAQVPAYFNGMELRTINLSALNSIAKMTKGTASIPGIEFYEESTLAVRS